MEVITTSINKSEKEHIINCWTSATTMNEKNCVTGKKWMAPIAWSGRQLELSAPQRQAQPAKKRGIHSF